MSQHEWQGSGSAYTLEWGGRVWFLEVDDERPGIRFPGGPTPSLLTLEGIAAVGRMDAGALSARTLIQVERFRGRIEATFSPPDWSGMRVRAAWFPSEGVEAMDLEIQVTGSAVDELKGVEVLVSSRWSHPAEALNGAEYSLVQVRDPRSASLSYDGREAISLLRSLTTLPLPASGERAFEPLWMHPPDATGATPYLEMVHPNDCARRLLWGPGTLGGPFWQARKVRYGLFGYDLEKGVVVRGRLRGVFVQAAELEMQGRSRFEEFLRERPPLGM